MASSATNGSEPARPHRVNWAAARAYWLALAPERRTFVAVSERFHVSAVRVGQVAKRDGWAKAAEELQEAEDRELNRTLRREIRNRTERLARTFEVYDRVSDLALELLPLNAAGEVDLDAARKRGELPSLNDVLGRIPGLFRMAELAAGEATDRPALSEVQPVLVAFARIAVLNATPERRGEILRELEAASAGLVDLDAG